MLAFCSCSTTYSSCLIKYWPKMAIHELHERADRYELSDVHAKDLLRMRQGQRTTHVKHEETKVRVCYVSEVAHTILVTLSTAYTHAEGIQLLSNLLLCAYVYVKLGNDGVVS